MVALGINQELYNFDAIPRDTGLEYMNIVGVFTHFVIMV